MTAVTTDRGYVKVREGVQAKGRRYVSEGRLRVVRVDHDLVYAECVGQGHAWELGHDQRGWYCSCPALRHCSHLVALQLVIRVEGSTMHRGGVPAVNPPSPIPLARRAHAGGHQTENRKAGAV